jgi:polyisoprenoid-binding protein YceI
MAKQKWVMDPAHSEILFKVRHMMLTNVSGTFDDCSAVMEAGQADFSDAEVRFVARVTSINTRNEQRDAHLRSADFFDTDKFPEMSFRSTSFRPTGPDTFRMSGPFTIKGVTKELSFEVTHTGTLVDVWGQVKAGFEISGVIPRSDFNLTWNAASDEGVVVLSEEVKLFLTIQMTKQL